MWAARPLHPKLAAWRNGRAYLCAGNCSNRPALGRLWSPASAVTLPLRLRFLDFLPPQAPEVLRAGPSRRYDGNKAGEQGKGGGVLVQLKWTLTWLSDKGLAQSCPSGDAPHTWAPPVRPVHLARAYRTLLPRAGTTTGIAMPLQALTCIHCRSSGSTQP